LTNLWPAIWHFIRSECGLLGNGDTGLFTFVGQQTANEDFTTTRVDHQLSDRDRLFGSYRFDDARFAAPTV